MSAIVQIPQPCHASWDKMQAQHQGRHCKACDKVVVDFTRMSDDEIRTWLREKAGEKVCGHFKAEQVQRLEIVVKPRELNHIRWSPKQLIQVAIFLVFSSSLFSCHSNSLDGAIPQIILQTEAMCDTTKKPIVQDSTTEILGKVIAPDKRCTPAPEPLVPEEDHRLMGEVMYVPEKPDTPVTSPKQSHFIRGKVSPANGFDRKASFPNGEVALQQWINEHKRYPEINRARMFRETVEVDVHISTLGRPRLISITSPENVPDVFQAEIARLLNEMPNWIVATKNGKPIASIEHVKFSFTLGD